VAQIVITAVITGIGTVAVAANHLAVTAESISYLPASGVAVAGTTLVGQTMGAGRKDLARRFARMVSWMGIAIMTLGGAVLFAFAPQLIMIFSKDPEVISLGAQVLRIVAFAEPLFGASIVASGALRGAGDSKGPFYISLATMWGVRITLSLLLAGQLGLVGVWLAMAAELCARGLIFMVRLYRGKWLEISLFRS
jgi:Na+-driven multidrug efflux pump